MEKKLTKSDNKRIKGVCGGIAECFNIDPTIVRVLWAVCTFGTSWFPGIILYIIMMLVMPEAGEKSMIIND